MQSRFINIDLIKIIAMFMVVFYHVSYYRLDYGYCSTDSNYIPNVNRLLMNICSISVPLFFISSGYCIFSKPLSHWKKTLKKVSTILILSLFWNIICPFPWWFFVTLSSLYILAPVISFLEEKYPIILKSCIGIVFLSTFVWNELSVISKHLSIHFFSDLPRHGLFTLYSIVYFYLGKCLITCKLSYKYAFVLFLLGFLLSIFDTVILTQFHHAIFDGVNQSFPALSALMMSISVFSVSMQIKIRFTDKILNIINFFASGCLSVYIFHLYIHKLIIMYIYDASRYSITTSLVVSILVMLTALTLGGIMRKTPFVNHLIKI